MIIFNILRVKTDDFRFRVDSIKIIQYMKDQFNYLLFATLRLTLVTFNVILEVSFSLAPSALRCITAL